MTQRDGDRAVNGRPDAEVTIIVDGANVVGSRPDGWWRDRAGAAVRLHDNLVTLAERGRQGIPAGDLATSEPATPAASEPAAPPAGTRLVSVTVVLVLEGAARTAVPRIAERARAASGARGSGAREDHPDGEVLVVSAPGSGDDEIVRQADRRAGHCIVVTADRELRRRCVAAGARVAGPSWLYGLL